MKSILLIAAFSVLVLSSFSQTLGETKEHAYMRKRFGYPWHTSYEFRNRDGWYSTSDKDGRWSGSASYSRSLNSFYLYDTDGNYIGRMRAR